MKLKHQILAFGVAGAALVGLAGGIGIVAADGMATNIGDAVLAAQSLQASQTADMMHDAIRGDAQRALVGAMEHKADEIQAANAGIDDHAQTLNDALKRIGELPMDDDSRAALTETIPVVEAYVRNAKGMITDAAQGVEAANTHQAALTAAFDDLENRLAKVSELLEANTTRQAEAAHAGVDRTQWAIGLAMLLATAVLVTGALWLSRRLAGDLGLAVKAADRLADGDLTAHIPVEGNDETRQLLTALQRMQQQTAGIVRGVKSNAEQVAGASGQIAQGNQDLSARTERQAAALQQTAATMSQVGAAVRTNAENAQQARQLAISAAAVAGEGGQVVGRVVETMNGIQDSSRRIADIIGTIDGIAFQTNILALNAAVEAARAGEQGRGFAVVAAEVRQLAQRSAEAAKEIKTLVGTSVDRVESGAALVGEAGATMQQILQSVQRVSDIVGEISAASEEQSRGVNEVGQAVQSMDQSTQQSAALVEETAAAADSMSQQARQLVDAVGAFRV